jgi:hypothetical protein
MAVELAEPQEVREGEMLKELMLMFSVGEK